MTTNTVLFVCPDNAFLGPLAEAYLNTVGQGRMRAFSAAPKPAERLDPWVRRLLSARGMHSDALEPKSWDIFLLPHAPRPDQIVSLAPSVDALHQPDWQGDPHQTAWNIVGSDKVLTGPKDDAMAAECFRRIRHAIDRVLNLATPDPEAFFRLAG